ncbi:MAG: hypothetical protein RIQ81_1492 [Pseudomonadota bacterium]
MVTRCATRMSIFSAALLLGGCFFEAGPGTARTEEDATQTTRAAGFHCRMDLMSGCIEAAIPPAPEVTVNGKPFFDANHLASEFQAVLADSAPTAQADLLAKGGKVEFLTRIDNKAFAKGFQIFIKGQTAHSADALATGGFLVHRIPEGAYNVRVQKLVKYKITQEPVPAGQDAAKEEVFCATLHAETNLEVYNAERVQHLFDDYELFLAECPR